MVLLKILIGCVQSQHGSKGVYYTFTNLLRIGFCIHWSFHLVIRFLRYRHGNLHWTLGSIVLSGGTILWSERLMPNSKQKLAKSKQRKRLARQRSQRREELANAKVKTINTLYKEGSLPKELYERVTVRKWKLKIKMPIVRQTNITSSRRAGRRFRQGFGGPSWRHCFQGMQLWREDPPKGLIFWSSCSVVLWAETGRGCRTRTITPCLRKS